MSLDPGQVPVEKYHGTGNDFLVVDAGSDAPGPTVPDRAAFARAHCDRETGVRAGSDGRRGADGVLFLDLATEPSPPRVVMTLVQPDGSVAEMCGNGARCVAAWAAARTDATEFMIDTPAGTRHATVGDRGERDGRPTADVTIEMGFPRFDSRSVPHAGEDELVGADVAGLPVTAVNTGVPHAVCFVEDLEERAESVDDVALDEVAPAVRHAEVFPEGANVTFASRTGETADGHPAFAQRTYERGVEGETRSCGTGAVAVAVAARKTGRLADGVESVQVSPPGGDLLVTVPERAPTRLAGPTELEFETTLTAVPGAAPGVGATGDLAATPEDE